MYDYASIGRIGSRVPMFVLVHTKVLGGTGFDAVSGTMRLISRESIHSFENQVMCTFKIFVQRARKLSFQQSRAPALS